MDTKITVEMNGRLVRIMPHTLELAKTMGAVETKKLLKNVPKELLTIPDPLPEMKVEEKPEPLPELKSEPVPEPEPAKIRKTPVRSKSKK